MRFRDEVDMFMRLIPFLILILFFSPLQASSSPDTYYVAPWGDDSNPGTKDRPWKTPGLATKKMKPGDTLIIMGGKYVLEKYDDDVLTPPSGLPNAWTVVRGEEGNRPVLAGRNSLPAAIDLSGRSYIRIENLEITSDNGAPFWDGVSALAGPISHVVLEDLYIHHIDGMGVNVADANDFKILNCSITYCAFGSIGGPQAQQGGWRNVLIQDCYLAYSGHYYRGGPGPSPEYDRPDGFGIEASDGPIEIARTIVEHNLGDGLDSKANNTYIHECIVANNYADGVKLWGDGSRLENTLIYGRGDGRRDETPWSPLVVCPEKPASFEIIGVTVDDEVGMNYVMYSQYDSDVPAKITVKNSIFSSRGPNAPIFMKQGVVDYKFEGCLFYFPQSSSVLNTQGELSFGPNDVNKLGRNNKYGDPLFVKTGWGDVGDYHLREGSPAVDMGVEVPLRRDLEGAPRPHGSGFDAGAYEFGSTPTAPLSAPVSPTRPVTSLTQMLTGGTRATSTTITITETVESQLGFELISLMVIAVFMVSLALLVRRSHRT